MKAGLVLLIFRQLLLNNSMARIFFTQMMLFSLSMGFSSSPVLKELLPTFTENSYYQLPVRRYVFFLPVSYIETKV